MVRVIKSLGPEQLEAYLQETPEETIRAELESGIFNDARNEIRIREWLGFQQSQRDEKRSATEGRQREREIEAAERSAAAAETAATEAKRNSRIAMVAAFIAVIAAVTSFFKG